MPEPYPIEVLDLRHFSARQLRPLLEQEAQVWQERMRWDYRNSIELLLQYLDSRILPGFVATIRGRVCGFTFCVYEGSKAVIGDIFVARDIDPAYGVSSIALLNALAKHLLEVLDASPDIERIESQLLLFDSGVLGAPFGNLGFNVFPRLFEQCQLTPGRPSERMLPAELELCRWSPNFYQPTGELIHASYHGHVDAEINDQYRTLHGSLRFLHNIVRFPGCGVFDPNSSWVLRERRTQTLAAALLCSRIAAGVAHVTQLCVAPPWRGRRLGRDLMRHAMEHLPTQGYHSLTLTVSEANHAAVRLYDELGFNRSHRFDAMVLDKKMVRYRFPRASAQTLTPIP